MPRTVEITVPSNRTDDLITEIKRIDGVIGLRMQRDISIQPPGDVVTIETTNRSLHSLMQLLDQCGVGQDPAVQSRPVSQPLLFHHPLSSQSQPTSVKRPGRRWKPLLPKRAT
jgi:hypothetical protein